MNNKIYFASSNSMNGFTGYFDSIYNAEKIKRIYIIKGGPGTGKSTMIRDIGKTFENVADCEYFLCSSDSSSLDGLIINKTIAIIDGTAPHVVNARFPGAVETILDSAKALNKRISTEREKIIDLTHKKTQSYKCAYAYLKAVGEIKMSYLKDTSIIDINKLENAVERFFRQRVNKSSEYHEEIRLIKGITPSGIYHTQSFENSANLAVMTFNSRGYEYILYKSVLKKCKEYGDNVQISFDPLFAHTPNAVNLEINKICFVNYNKELHGNIDYDKNKMINFDRFFKKTALSELNSRIKFAEKCSVNLCEEAIHHLKEASSYHKELEKIYTKYMDYDIIDYIKQSTIDEIRISL